MDKETISWLEESAVIVQFISMSFEIIGIGLAFIELKFKPLANRLENWIAVADNRARALAYKMLEHKYFSILVTLFIFVVFFFEIPSFFGFWDSVLPEALKPIQRYLFWITLPLIIPFIVGLFFILISAWITSLNQFSNGRAIGALGVFVASMGLVGELFQVIVIILTRNPG